MTAILGFRRNGQTWLASDTLCSLGDGMIDTDKIAQGKNFSVAFADRARAAQLVEMELDEFKAPEIWSIREAFRFSQWVRELMVKHGAKKEAAADYELPGHPLLMILACKNGMLFTVCGDGTVFRQKKWVAYGTGGDLALGVPFALWGDSKIRNIDMASRAVAAGKNFSRSVGGRTLIRQVA